MHITRRNVIASILVAAASSDAWADLYDDYINSKSKRPFVAFLSRESDGALGKPGHSFVAIGSELDNGLLVYERLLGYYIKDESTFNQIKSAFTKVTGDLKSKIGDVSWALQYRVTVDEAKHKSALKVADRWIADDPKYQLFASGGKNCSSFAAEVAQAVGLKVPSGSGMKLPMTFMRELRDLNK